jgi:hypothetical protein
MMLELRGGIGDDDVVSQPTPTIAKYMIKRCHPVRGWCIFLQNHAPDIAVVEFSAPRPYRRKAYACGLHHQYVRI